MRVRELYLRGKQQLADAGIDTAALDASLLLEQLSGWDRTAQLMHGDDPAPQSWIAPFHAQIARRAAGEPLQYLLGAWPFMAHSFAVGPGVLIPRPETELLVREALAFCGHRPCRIIDLCAGSGAVGWSCAAALPDCTVTAVELSPDALPYLHRNREAIAPDPQRTRILQGDITRSETAEAAGVAEVILSNPPYIPTDDLAGLQREVHREPRMALDGGADGLDFYRAILRIWRPMLTAGGLLAVECGIGQGAALADAFRAAGLRDVQIRPDFSGIDRVVRGIAPCAAE